MFNPLIDNKINDTFTSISQQINSSVSAHNNHDDFQKIQNIIIVRKKLQTPCFLVENERQIRLNINRC